MAGGKETRRYLELAAGLPVPEGGEAYIVGGAVRDMLMGRECSDLDVVVSCDPGVFAREAGDAMGGSAFVMDAGRDVHRVMFRHGPVTQLDISPLKGGILDDLAARDFTINAMAVLISGAAGWEPEIIDPFGGREDLKAGNVRALSERSLVEDPLRMMRAFRLASQLGFRVAKETLALIVVHARSISEVSPERVRDELYTMLSSDGTEGALRAMHSAGLLFEVLPELVPMAEVGQGPPHAYDLLEHSLRAAGHAEVVMADTARWFVGRSDEVDAFLASRVDGLIDMRGVVKLCALMHDTGKPATLKIENGRPRFFGHEDAGAGINDAVAERLRMSDRVRAALTRTAALHMRPLNLSRETLTPRAVHRLARDVGDYLPALVVVALADALATRERADEAVTDVEGVVRALTDYYYGPYAETMGNPLITGHDVIQRFGLKPGPVIGRILSDVEEMRADGTLRDKEGALEYIRVNLGRYTG